MTDRVPFHHLRSGRGAPLLLLHGVGHHLQAWDPVVPALAEGFEVVALDLPGFGRSAPLQAGVRPTVQAYARAVAGWLSEAGLGRPHVAGNSLGGAIALELTRLGAVRTATAIAPAGFWTPAERRYAQRSLGVLADVPRPVRPVLRAAARHAAGRAVLGAQLFARPWRIPPEEFVATLDDAWASPALSPTLDALDAYAFARGGELDGVPVTVAWGTRDWLLLAGRQAPRARRSLPGARHVALPGLGHAPFHDDPALVAATVRDGARDAPQRQ